MIHSLEIRLDIYLRNEVTKLTNQMIDIWYISTTLSNNIITRVYIMYLQQN